MDDQPLDLSAKVFDRSKNLAEVINDRSFDLGSSLKDFKRRENLAKEMDDKPLDLSTKVFDRRKNLSEVTNDRSFDLGSAPKDFKRRENLSKDMNIQPQYNSILNYLLTSPKKYLESSLKEKGIMSQEPSSDPGTKGQKTSNNTSIEMFQEDLKTIKTSYKDTNSRDNIDTGTSASDSCLFKMLQDEKKVTFDVCYDDESDRRDCISTEPSTSKGVKGNHDFVSTQNSCIGSSQELFYDCVLCNRRFFNSSAFIYHFKIHGNHYVCNFCKKEYRQAPNFIKHIEKHTIEDETPRICSNPSKSVSK